MRQLIIGDIHGCHDEFQELLDQSGISSDDQIIAVGDLMDRGPNPREVIRFFLQTPGAFSIRGNHEEYHLRCRQNKMQPTITQIITRWLLDETYCDALNYAARLPLAIELPDAMIAHGFYEPNTKLRDQKEEILLGMKEAEVYLRQKYERPWYAYYADEKPLIVGHRDYGAFDKPFIYQDRVFAIDTRCVLGGALTGIVLPDFRFVSVPARENYWSNIQERFGIIRQ